MQRLDMPGADVTFWPRSYLGYDPDELFRVLLNNVEWQQNEFNFYGKTVLEPRLVAWYSDSCYMYSGIMLPPQPMGPLLSDLAATLSRTTGAYFNGVLLNYYRDGRDSIGMHADDEFEFGDNPTIASLSLGDSRQFDFQRKDKSLPKTSIVLNHGSLLVMAGTTQTYWKHGIQKTKEPAGPRINLTFRQIVFPRVYVPA